MGDEERAQLRLAVATIPATSQVRNFKLESGSILRSACLLTQSDSERLLVRTTECDGKKGGRRGGVLEENVVVFEGGNGGRQRRSVADGRLRGLLVAAAATADNTNALAASARLSRHYVKVKPISVELCRQAVRGP